MSIIMQQKLQKAPDTLYLNEDIYRKALFSGVGIFWTGISVGVSNLVCG